MISPSPYAFSSDKITAVYQSNNPLIADEHSTTRPPPVYDNLFPTNTTISVPSQESYMVGYIINSNMRFTYSMRLKIFEQIDLMLQVFKYIAIT